MGDASFPAGYWERFRQVVKATDPNALIVGELVAEGLDDAALPRAATARTRR